MKKYCFLLLCLLLLLGACRKKEQNRTEEARPFDTEEPILMEETAAPEAKETSDGPVSLSDMLEDITKALDDSDPEVWYHHYNNRSIVYKDGFTYRIFSDGIYRRAAGSTDWEPLYQGKMSGNHALEAYREFLYFTLDREGLDPNPSTKFVPQTLWQLDRNTLECKKIGDMAENTPYIFSIYEENLYIGYSLFGALRYNVYPLDAEGMPGEKMAEDSPDFICAKQNAYSLEEEAHIMQEGGGAPSDSPQMSDMEREVIPIPCCTAMLNGYYVTTKYYNELSAHFYLTNSATGEQQFLFDAYIILAVTPTGIFYHETAADADPFHYYSFYQKEPHPFLKEEITYEHFRLLTYDRAWLYFYDDNRIMRMSRSTGETEAFLDVNSENLNISYCAVDPEYFYLDEEMYPL